MGTPSDELQAALYAALLADLAVAAVVETRVHDGRPEEFPCITFGPSDYVPLDLDCVAARIEAVQIDCWVRDNGRLWPAKDLADKVKAALHGAELALATHALARLEVTAVRCFMDRDGLTGHGVVSLEAEVEER